MRQVVYDEMDYETAEENSMDVDQEEADKVQEVPMVFATRTKPIKNNKFAKRVGAKTAKIILHWLQDVIILPRIVPICRTHPRNYAVSLVPLT